jgi:hypothetical protein
VEIVEALMNCIEERFLADGGLSPSMFGHSFAHNKLSREQFNKLINYKSYR